MDSLEQNYIELWNAIKNEYIAKADKLDAEQRMEFNDAMEDFSSEVSAATDWLEADWEEFKARVDKKWQEFAISIQSDETDDETN